MTAESVTYAVIYAAKSTVDRNASIPEQLSDCREMCAENGWQVLGELVDENFTAYTGNRGPGLAAAIELAMETARENGATMPDHPVMLVAQHTSRFARGDGSAPDAPRALVELWHEWARACIRGRLVENDLAMATSSAAAAQGEADHNESKRKSISVKKGLRRRARDRGKPHGGPPPYAHQWADGNLQVVPAQVPVVRRIYADTLAGLSQRTIARALNAEGIPAAGGGLWVQSTIRSILRSPLYMGKVKLGDEVYAGEHAPIVDEATWNAVQQRAVTGREQADKNGQRRGAAPGGNPGVGRNVRRGANHLMVRGLLRCGQCGSAMTPHTEPRAGGLNYEVYRCLGRSLHGPEYCSQGPIHRADVDDALMADLAARYLDLEATRERVRTRFAVDASAATEAEKQADHELMRAQDRLKVVERGWQNGVIDDANYTRQSAELIEEIAGAEAALATARGRRAMCAATVPELPDEVLKALAQLRERVVGRVTLTTDRDRLRALLRVLFTEIRYLPIGHPWLASLTVRASAAPITADAYLLPILGPGTILGYSGEASDADYELAEATDSLGPYDPSDPTPTALLSRAELPIHRSSTSMSVDERTGLAM